MDARKEEKNATLQFFFDWGENASQAVKNLSRVYGPGTVS